MKVLLVNKFLYPKGGDAVSVLETGALLKEKGHEVAYWGMKHPNNPAYPYEEYFVDNIDYKARLSMRTKIDLAFKVLYSYEAKRKIKKLLEVYQPDVVHLHNFAHQISPSIVDTFSRHNIPMVMTMHDYKVVCPTYNMLSHEEICRKCKGGKYYWCFFQRCNDNSYLKSIINTAEMYLHHYVLNIYSKIDTFIAPSKFLRDKVREAGVKKKIEYLPNFVRLDDCPDNAVKKDGFIYFGRLSKEKGILTLLDAIGGLSAHLKIIGDGPLKEELTLRIKKEGMSNVSYLGYKTGNDLYSEIKNSFAVILPSKYYENNPRSILEAFVLGKAVIGSKIGGIPELIREGETGATFALEDVKDLRNKITYFIEHRGKVEAMGRKAREFVKHAFGPEEHYRKLMRIYHAAIKEHRR